MRALRWLLTLALAPILIVATSTSTEAATKRGPAVAFSWEWDGLAPGAYGNCTASANWVRVNDQNPYIHVSGLDCSAGWNFDLSNGGDDEDYFTVHAGCDGPEGYLFNYTVHAWEHDDAFDVLPDPEIDVPDNCNVTGLSISYLEEGWGQDSDYDVTPTLALGVPPAPSEAADPITPGTCPLYDVGKVRLWAIAPGVRPGWMDPVTNIGASGGLALRVTGLSKSPSITGLYGYVWWKQTNNTAGAVNFGQAVPGSTTGYTKMTGSMGEWFSRGGTQYTDFTTGNYKEVSVFLGVMPTYASTAPPVTPPANDPANCKFVFGVPRDVSGITGPISIGDSGGGTVTPDDPEPVPVNDPAEDVDDGSCEGFSVFDPTSWAGAGICVLVKAVNALIGVVAGIADAILGGLGDVLAALFVPSDGFLDGKIDDVKDAWDDTPPGEILGTVTAIPAMLDAPSSTGCGGPQVQLDNVDVPGIGGGGEGGSTMLRPFSTCSEAMGNFATIVRIALSAGIAIGAAFAALRILGGAFGLNQGIGGTR